MSNGNRIVSGVGDDAIAALSEQLARRPPSHRSRPSSRAPSPDPAESTARGKRQSRANSPPPLPSPRSSHSHHIDEPYLQPHHKGRSEPTAEADQDATDRRARRKTVIFDEAPNVEHSAPVYAEHEHRKRRKLGTFDGVFTPVCLNVLGVILFLRFGFLLGQAGLLGVLAMLALAYLIDFATTASVSAIATNGHVRGIIFLLGQAANAALNILGFVEATIEIFTVSKSADYAILPESQAWLFIYSSTLLSICVAVCLVGSKLFKHATSAIALLMIVSIASIPISLMLKSPFVDLSGSHAMRYTGPRLHTLRANLFPHFTSGAAGSALPPHQREGWQSTFGVLFPACTGILAGASMSGDLRKPSKSISKGTIWGLGVTFAVYVVVLLVMSCSVSRETFREDLGVLQDISVAPVLIHAGVLGSTLYSALLGITACAKILQAIARDNLIPVLSPFRQGTEHNDDPTYAVLATYAVCQFILFADNVNNVASLVTMASLLVFGIISLACFVLRVSASPNFRPSFTYFNEWTALAGILLCFGTMMLTDLAAAGLAMIVAILLIVVIHYTSEAKEWGDAAQALMYHQVRKYLLLLDERKQHIKFWRPQVLLLTADPRQDWTAILFSNSLKKGGLLVLGHVLKGSFAERLHDLRQQQMAWLRLVDVSHVKAFVDIAIADNERAGSRNLMLSCGLGGMRPNIVVVTYPEGFERRGRIVRRPTKEASASSDITLHAVPEPPPHAIEVIGALPTDHERQESPISATAFVGVVEDAVALNKAVGICYGFGDLRVPNKERSRSGKGKRYLDLWPTLSGATGWATYTMVLILGTTLTSTSTWRKHTLRVNVFVESPSDITAERHRISALLAHLRVRAELRVFALATGRLQTYEMLVKGVHADSERAEKVEEALGRNAWYESLNVLRKRTKRHRGGSYNGSRPTSPSAPSSPSSSRPLSPANGVSPRPEAKHWQSFNDGLAANRSNRNALRIDTSVLDARTGDSSDSDASSSSDEYTDDEDPDLASLATPQATKTFAAFARDGLPDEPRRHYGSLGSTSRSRPVPTEQDSDDEDDDQTTTPKARTSRLAQTQGTPTKGGQRKPIPSPTSSSLPTLSFGDLPLRGQLVILNELMAAHSGEDTAVIITSLAPPESGSAESYEASVAWLDLLRHWLNGLPPTLAVSSREQVMTTVL